VLTSPLNEISYWAHTVMYWTAGGLRTNGSLFLLTQGQVDQGMTGNVVVLKMSSVWDVWQDADLEVDLPILQRYLSWFPG
jgi:hypothetical protein